MTTYGHCPDSVIIDSDKLISVSAINIAALLNITRALYVSAHIINEPQLRLPTWHVYGLLAALYGTLF